jgi:hypothetical protein
MNITEQEWNDLLAQLPERERKVVLARFYEGKTWRTVGQIIGVSHERARKIGEKAIERLRLAINDNPIIRQRERLTIAIPKQTGWFVDNTRWRAVEKFEAFKKRMKRAVTVKVNNSWPQHIKYCGPIEVTLANGRKIKGNGIVEAKGHSI